MSNEHLDRAIEAGTKAVCATCRLGKQDGDSIECRLYPPTYAGQRILSGWYVQQVWVYPKMNPDDFCGQHQEKAQ